MDTMFASAGVASRHQYDVVTQEAPVTVQRPKGALAHAAAPVLAMIPHVVTNVESHAFVTSDYWLINFGRAIGHRYYEDEGQKAFELLQRNLGNKFEATIAKAARIAQEPVPTKPAEQFELLKKVAGPMIALYSSEYNIPTKMGMAHPMIPSHG